MSQNPDQSPASELPPLPPVPPVRNVPVLQKLATSPFPRSGFPLLGILASVYEHITTCVAQTEQSRSG
jgi:hypothetical protein